MNNDKIKELTFENYIWVIYIVVAIVNIYGDELIKKSIIENIERKIEGLDELIEQAVEESKIYEF